MNLHNVQKYINYRFVPLSMSQVITRMIIMWILCGISVLLGSTSYWEILFFLLCNLLLICICVHILRSGIHRKESKFLWDGSTFIMIPVIINTIAYRMLTWGSEGDLVLAFVLFALLLLWFIVLGLLVFWNIKKNKYEDSVSSSSFSPIPYLFSALAIFTAKLCLERIPNQLGLQIVALILIVISYLLAFGWTNIIRLILSYRITSIF